MKLGDCGWINENLEFKVKLFFGEVWITICAGNLVVNCLFFCSALFEGEFFVMDCDLGGIELNCSIADLGWIY